MSEPFEEIANIDRLVHEPARLAILTALEACRSADFMFLQSLTGLSRGNLSLHLGKLEARGLIAVEKAFVRKMPRTTLRLTKEGKTAIRAYWRRLDTTRRAASRWTLRRMISPNPALHSRRM